MSSLENRTAAIEKMRQFGTAMSVIFDALTVIGIEHDKISSKWRPSLNNLITQLVNKYPPTLNNETSANREHFQITKLDLETLTGNVMTLIEKGFTEIGMKGFEDDDLLKELAVAIRGAVEYEKGFRDAEKKSRGTPA